MRCAVPRWVLGGSVLGWLAALGCAAVPAPEQAFERGPLPYHVGVYLEARGGTRSVPPAPAGRASEPGSTDPRALAAGDGGGGGAEAEGEAPARPRPPDPAARLPQSPQPPKQPPQPQQPIRFRRSPAALAAAVAKDLSREGRGTFSRTKVIAASSRAEAIRAAKGLDALVVLGFRTRAQYDEHSPSVAWAALEVTCWLFGGIPAWFVPTVEFFTDGRLDVEVVDLHQARLRQWLEAKEGSASEEAPRPDWTARLEAPAENVSLWDRSHPFDRPLDYLLTIVVPPMVLAPGDRDRVSEELTGDLTADLSGQLSRALRRRFLDAERSRALSIAFLAPDPRGAVGEAALKLKLAVASRGKGRVAAFDVHRFAAGGKRFRWEMPRSDVQRLATGAAAAPAGGYFALDLPAPIPLEAGENTIKVRILRDDGETVTRTMVYTR